jgi:hypothetical protein
MVGLTIILIIIFIWLAYELWRAPLIEEYTGKVIRPTKKLSDLFKKKK